jgi:hypothetical protein
VPNAFFRAKSLWEARQQRAAFALLGDHLEQELGAQPFALAPHLIEADAMWFETAVAIMLQGTLSLSAETILRVPFCRAFVALWRLDPSSHWLVWLRSYDFRQAPREGPFDLEAHAPPPNGEDDFAALVEALEASARRGLLSMDPADYPHGGRALLTVEDIAGLDEALRGPLLARLPAAAAACAPDFWQRLAREDGEGVVCRFLHHLFAHDNKALSFSERIWQIIQERHPSYAGAARASLRTLLARGDEALLRDIVRYDAARPSVSDGRKWLEALLASMTDGDFARLGGP